jgi:N-formylglutamate deformylase
LLFDSPHSGIHRPTDFHSDAPLSALLSGWDAFVDVLWMGGVEQGGVLLKALFPRVYIDPNRAESDLDPTLLCEPWPEPLSPQAYSARGMGLIRRDALPGIPMYRTGLSVAAVRHRIEAFYRPYRQALTQAAERAIQRHGGYCHINCHSMKSRGNAMNVDSGATRPDIVISDRLGTTASPPFTRWVADYFAACGYQVRINDPYRGGDLVASFGDPARRRHSIQIEINRSLYMDESSFTPHAGFQSLKKNLDGFCAALAAYVRERLDSPAGA